MGSSFSKELDIFCRFPEGSTLDPLPSNIDICDLFFIDMSSDIGNYADDTTPYKGAPYYDKLKESDNLFGGSSIITSKLTLVNVIFFSSPSVTKCHFFLSPYQSATIKHQ